jgi:hypothetical protein
MLTDRFFCFIHFPSLLKHSSTESGYFIHTFHSNLICFLGKTGTVVQQERLPHSSYLKMAVPSHLLDGWHQDLCLTLSSAGRWKWVITKPPVHSFLWDFGVISRNSGLPMSKTQRGKVN